MRSSKLLHKAINFIWSLFLHGFLTLLPITLTIVIFNISFKVIASWLEPIHNLEPEFLTKIPYAEFLLVIGAILLLGFVLKILLLQPIIHAAEALIFRIPLVRPIYSGIKQLVIAFVSQDKGSFKKVVVVEYPRKGAYSLGFLTSEAPSNLALSPEKKFFTVFIPTTPNPTSGFLIVLAEDEIRMTNYTRQEAMALIISGGIIQPEKTDDETSND